MRMREHECLAGRSAWIAMSGGVDSSVAAYLAKEAGLAVTGVTMRLYDGNSERAQSEAAQPDAQTNAQMDAQTNMQVDLQDGSAAGAKEQTCGKKQDLEDARAVCDRLGIPFDVLELTTDFDASVIRPFVEAYETGLTPNPCILCNRALKFGKLGEMARAAGQDYVVTGHYARIEHDEEAGRWMLRRGLDPKKDQSYVLYQMTQEELAHTLFPVGSIEKEETREIARSLGLNVAEKKESQDICFIPDGDYTAFIRRYTGKEYPPGDFIDVATGQILGQHQGLIRYTRGQGRHLGLALTHRMYVLGKDAAKNQVLLGENEDLFSKQLTARAMNWIVPEPSGALRVLAKARYSQKAAPATVWALEDGRMQLEFDQPERAITAGQAVVLYDGEYVVGGGTIE